MLGLVRYEREVCKCGNHFSLTDPTDPRNVFVPDKRECPVCAGLEKVWRQQRKDDETWEKRNPDAPVMSARPSDGVMPYLRLATPAEVEQRKAVHRGHTS